MKRVAILTSGGDSPGMNAALRAAVRCGIASGMEIYGVHRGYEGLMDGDLELMDRKSVADILHRGGTILKSARSSRFMTEEGQKQAVNVLNTYRIDALIVIGGNGSLAGGLALVKRGITVMGLPGTIDNDLNYTDYTIGFDTAVNTVLEAISKLRDTSSSHDKTTLIEVMGRDCGDIALHAAVAGGAEYVLLPEFDYDEKSLYRKLLESENKGKLHSIIIKAEGSKHTSHEMIDLIKENTGVEARLVVLSYLQRGGSPTYKDRMLATLTAAKAIELIEQESDSKAIGVCDNKIVACDLEEALNMEKKDDNYLIHLVDVLSR